MHASLFYIIAVCFVVVVVAVVVADVIRDGVVEDDVCLVRNLLSRYYC